ncbi:MAG: tetratricopeptide repeat protein [Desulfobacteraceae bacterium]|nr:tetratricopeptide repeat protein [Desulfobacteraceae bacterium]
MQNPNLTITETLQQAIDYHKANRLQRAEQLYRAILQAQPKHTDANHNLGVLAVQMNKVEQSLPFFKIALENNPANGQYWLSYIDALIKSGNRDTARQVLKQGKEKGLSGDGVDQLAIQLKEQKMHPNDKNDLEPAIQFRESGQYQQASSWLEDWLTKNPDDPGALAHLAHVYLLLRNETSAMGMIKRAISIAPDLAVVQRNLARLYLKQNQTHHALSAAIKAVTVEPHFYENRLVLSTAYAASGQDIKALELVEAIIKDKANYAEAYATRALYRFNNGDRQGALVDCKKALSIKPYLTQLWGLSANLYYQDNNLLQAISSLEQALVHEPGSIDYMIMLGEYKRQAGIVEEALTLLKKAVELAPDNANAWANYGTALQQDEQLTEAKNAYNNALGINPNMGEVANNLATLAMNDGDNEKALELFEKVNLFNPDYADAYNYRGIVFRELGHLEEAIKSYEEAIRCKPHYAEAYINRGNALSELGQSEQALESYDTAIQLKPDFVEGYINRGNTLKELGQPKRALESYDKAIQLNPL